MGKWSNRAPKGALYQWLLDHRDYDGNDCIAWPFNHALEGRGLVTVDGKNKVAPRVMCELVNGPPPSPAHDAAHSCGNGHNGCLTPKHLSWKTRQENVDDSKAHGTMIKGEKVGSSKLKEIQVRTIKMRLANGEHPKSIAADYGVSASAIWGIRHNINWRWLT